MSVRAARGSWGIVALVTGLGLAGCGAGTEPEAPVPSGMVVAIPTDGSDPGTALDIGGPDLTQRCISGDVPVLVDNATVSSSCGEIPPASAEELAAIEGPLWSGVDLVPGTYWVVLVCSGPGAHTFGSTTPGLDQEVTVECDPEGAAVRQELGTVTEETTGTISGAPTAGGVTYLSWLVREGKRE